MITGQSPRLNWTENTDGKKRTIEQAKETARKHGVNIPEDVDFFEDDEGELPGHVTARGPKVVAVFGHETYELEKLRPILKEEKTSIEQFIGHTCADNPGNFHDEAWEFADQLIQRMRKGEIK